MSEPTICCPHCKEEIKLTESLAAPLVESTRRHYEEQLKQKEQDYCRREAYLKECQDSITKERETLDEQIALKLKTERTKIAGEEARRVRLELSTDLEQKAREIADLHQVLKVKDEKLTEAQKAQAEIIRQQRELEDARREIDLTVEKRIQESLAATREQAKQEAEEALKLKVLEKEHTIASMQKQIEELKRRAEQGSQQLQGEAQELELESLLRAKFPHDAVDPVPKGEFGGDVIHSIMGPLGSACGKILWESKRTKNWSDGWLAKLREDQRAAHAEISVIVSQALPKGVESFDHVDGVWVAHPRVVLPLAACLRHSLIELSLARKASEGQQSKMELVYQYLTGRRFRQRVEAIVEAFSEMKIDLDKERKVITKQWAKREEHIEQVMNATVGMYGDLQGIAGRSLQEIDGLTMAALETSELPISEKSQDTLLTDSEFRFADGGPLSES